MNILYTERMFNSITFDLIFSIGVKELIIGKCKILKILDSCEHSVNQTSSNISDDSHHRIAEGIIPSFRLSKTNRSLSCCLQFCLHRDMRFYWNNEDSQKLVSRTNIEILE